MLLSEVLDSPDVKEICAPVVHIEDSPARLAPQPRVSHRWGKGILKPRAGIVMEMPVPDVPLEQLLQLPQFWNSWKADSLQAGDTHDSHEF